MRKFILLFCLLVGCNEQPQKTGDLDQECNSNGSCNSALLKCIYKSGGKYACLPVDNSPPRPYESERFCAVCAEKCGDAGVKKCEYSDTSVWGAAPATCECK